VLVPLHRCRSRTRGGWPACGGVVNVSDHARRLSSCAVERVAVRTSPVGRTTAFEVEAGGDFWAHDGPHRIGSQAQNVARYGHRRDDLGPESVVRRRG